MQTTGQNWQCSFFAGYTKAFETKDAITGHVYARDAYIRISPMVSFTKVKLVVAAECEYITAAQGNTESFFKVIDSLPVANIRRILSLGYLF